VYSMWYWTRMKKGPIVFNFYPISDFPLYVQISSLYPRSCNFIDQNCHRNFAFAIVIWKLFFESFQIKLTLCATLILFWYISGHYNLFSFVLFKDLFDVTIFWAKL
jgi:hypothetical protein